MALATRSARAPRRGPGKSVLDRWIGSPEEHEDLLLTLHLRVYGEGVCQCGYCNRARARKGEPRAGQAPRKKAT